MRPTISSTAAAPCSSGSFSFLTRRPILPCETLPDSVRPDRDAGGSDGLGDLTAHGSGADDGSLEDEHGVLGTPVTNEGSPGGYRAGSPSAASSTAKRRSVRLSDSRWGRRTKSASTIHMPGRAPLISY